LLADLHCHTTASDGSLPAVELVDRAIEREVELLAITDHDTLDGYLSAKAHADASNIRLISGIEFSSTWGKMGVHIVGLHVDVENPELQAAVVSQKAARHQRGKLIGERLANKGFDDVYVGAKAIAGESQIGRPHFAQFMVQQGYVSDIKQAFKRYLGAGKIGDVKATWPAMKTVVEWIVQSGGVAVLAHPMHYKITNTKLRALVTDFKEAGGMAIEVVSGLLPNDRVQYLAELAQKFEMHASCGSDFHHPDTPWGDIGRMSPLPVSCKPVWHLFE
jgi:predicted metal-dependent phosphoesterase TrpH